MYLWKCWRDSRAAFLFLTGLLMAFVSGVVVLSALSYADARGPIQGMSDASRLYFWDMVITILIQGAIVLFSSDGRGFCELRGGCRISIRHGGLPGLTRPRPRRYFIWISWAVRTR